MAIVEQQLAPFASRLFAVWEASGSNSNLCPTLQRLYDGFNGGFFWGRALLIRPTHRTDGTPLTTTEWNDESLWKGQYEMPVEA